MYKLPVLSTLVRRGTFGYSTFWAPKTLSYSFTRLTQQLYSTVKTVKAVRAVEQMGKHQLTFARIQHAAMSKYTLERDSTFPKFDLSQKRNVLEMLNVFEELEDPSPANMMFVLVWIARGVWSDKRQREALEEEKIVYLKLLDSIQATIHSLAPQELGVTFWALGKLKEKHHPLIKACEEAILSQGVSTLDHKTISQIMGFPLLRMRNSRIFEELEDGIISGIVELPMFDVRGLAQILLSFARTANGSAELFNCFTSEILSREFSAMQNNDLCQFVWSFARRGYKADELFEKVEAECLERMWGTWKTGDISMIVWAFASQGKGSVDFFKEFSEKILENNVKYFRNDDLSQLVWALGKAGVANKSIFNRIEAEVLRRGVENFFVKDREMMSEGFHLANSGKDFFQEIV